MAELLLELLSEEIPARMQDRAAADLKRLVCAGLDEAGLAYTRAEAFATPRRLALVVEGLPERQPDSRIERKGPRVGAPEKAIAGFLNSVGLARDQLEVRETPKGAVYMAVIERKGRPTREVIAEIVPNVLWNFPWPKSMKWGKGSRFTWVRPLRRILCIFDGKVVNFQISGYGYQPYGKGVFRDTGHDLESQEQTQGHRFLAPEPFAVRDYADYRGRLRAAYVMLDAAERRAAIEDDAQCRAAEEGLRLRPDPALVAENAGLVEWPVVLLGTIDPESMTLPPEVLTTAMRAHQKYFALEDETGALAPRFALVANMPRSDDGERDKQIVAGNERVLRARLADARFFWDQDRKRTLESRVPALDSVVFHARLGSLGDKAKRIARLAREIAACVPEADADQAARAGLLCKADLTTEMVGEFPELQGVMGRYYALHDGEPETVADAIAAHYAPQGPNDACPNAPVSVAVALADKIDTLVGFWTIDEKPTGSKDPFALRRAALGVIRLIVENGLRISLLSFFETAAGGYADIAEKASDGAVADDLLAFFADRLKVHLREKGVRHDLIAAVFALGGEDDLVRLLARVEALQRFLATDDGERLLTAYRRAANIVRIEEKRDGLRYDGEPDPALYEAEDERMLADRLAEVDRDAGEALEREDFEAAMAALAALRGPVDAFFDNVTVNCDDAPLRRNRLLLLGRIRAALDAVADFSKIEG